MDGFLMEERRRKEWGEGRKRGRGETLLALVLEGMRGDVLVSRDDGFCLVGWLVMRVAGEGRLPFGRVAGSSDRSASWEGCARELTESRREGFYFGLLCSVGDEVRTTRDAARGKGASLQGRWETWLRAQSILEKERGRGKGWVSRVMGDWAGESFGLVGVGGKFRKRNGC
jgi:hypothetical protein